MFASLRFAAMRVAVPQTPVRAAPRTIAAAFSSDAAAEEESGPDARVLAFLRAVPAQKDLTKHADEFESFAELAAVESLTLKDMGMAVKDRKVVLSHLNKLDRGTWSFQ